MVQPRAVESNRVELPCSNRHSISLRRFEREIPHTSAIKAAGRATRILNLLDALVVTLPRSRVLLCPAIGGLAFAKALLQFGSGLESIDWVLLEAFEDGFFHVSGNFWQ